MSVAPAWRVRLADAGIEFPARPDETLLQAALRAGAPLPSTCRAGTCRRCLHVLVEGRIAWLVEWPGVTPEEKQAGCILPCVARAASDVVLARE